MKHKILVSVLLVGLSGCMKIAKKDAENKIAPQVVTNEVPEEKNTRSQTELTYSYDVDGKANLKKVRFSAAASWPASVVVKKTDGDKASEFGAEFNENAEWSDLLISENKVNYQFFSKLEEQLILLDEVEVLPPLSIDVAEDLNLAQKYSLNQKTKLIYFESLNLGLQKRIYFENYSGKIQIENLTSQSGFIQAYPANARAVNDVDGKDGGVIRIEILSGTGDITFLMKGENGGNGSPAKPPDATKKGANGERGTPSKFEYVHLGNAQIAMKCSTTPGTGGNGIKGHEGYGGHEGKSGGHSGRAIITNYSTQLEIMMESQAGAYGIGSAGGTGGEGGDPGSGADGADEDHQILLRASNSCIRLNDGSCYALPISEDLRCPHAASGIKGGTGGNGPTASNGIDGTKQKSCLYQGEQKVKCINE